MVVSQITSVHPETPDETLAVSNSERRHSRGLAHLGVIQEIERRKLKFDLIVGTSMGAIIGGLYASFGNSIQVLEILNNFFKSRIFIKAASNAVDEDSAFVSPDGFFNRFMWLFKQGVFYTRTMIQTELVRADLFAELMAKIVPDVLIEDLPVPFAAVAMDLETGEEIVLTRGSLRHAIAASCSIPGIFPPVRMNGRILVDGGWTDNVPAAPAVALGAHFVLAVDATLEIPGMSSHPRSALELLFRCNEITRILLTRHRKTAADVLIVPEIGEVFWADFKAIDHCMAAGRRAFIEKAATISKKIVLRKVLTLLGLVHPVRTTRWKHPMVIL